MKAFIDAHGSELAKGSIGVLSTTVGFLTSLEESVEYYMRCTSLAIGMIVGLLTAVSIVRGWRKRTKP